MYNDKVLVLWVNSEMSNIFSNQNTIHDCNAINHTCLGSFLSTSLNTPINGAYGMIFAYIAENNAWHFQVSILTDNTIWERSNINHEVWSEWKQISTF